MFVMKSLVIAFAMYSKIPMPKVEWNEKNMRFVLCFFPFVGLIQGMVLYGCWRFFVMLDQIGMMSAAVLTILPVVVTGGIHVDGFLDTIDALSSYQTRERKLEILKDSHTGAFAIIGAIVYFVLYFGGITELHTDIQWKLLSIGFVMSRVFSGLAIVYWKGAKKEGLLYAFSSIAHKTITRCFLLILLLLCMGILFWIKPVAAMAMGSVAVLLMLYYKRMSYQEFGGITGDLAGFFLQICELGLLYTIAFI